MQRRRFIRATMFGANHRSIGGEVAAQSAFRGLRTGKGSKRAGKDYLPLVVYLLVAGLFAALAPAFATAGEDERGRQGEDERTRNRGIEALEAKIAFLEVSVSALQGQVTKLQSQLTEVQCNHALALGPFVSVNAKSEIGVNGPNITFQGANIHIVSGSGSTNDNGVPRGLGNLIIGYDEDPQHYVDGSPFNDLPLNPLMTGDRGGSHNLVIGAANRFTRGASGGLVVGTANTIQGYGASVAGGAGNTATDYGSSVSGGFSNAAGGFYASVSGGRSNATAGPYSSVSGGDSNTAGTNCGGTCGFAASFSGGQGNFASGNYTSVTGGTNNTAFDLYSSVTGGTGNTAGSLVIFEAGIGASVLGGSGNNAGGKNSVVIGGQNVTNNIDNSIAPKAP